MSLLEKIQLGIVVPLEGRDHWRDFSEAFRSLTSKYQPHQGARECARRLRQMEKTRSQDCTELHPELRGAVSGSLRYNVVFV